MVKQHVKRIAVGLIVFVVAALLLGYVGTTYSAHRLVGCQLGSGGDCGVIGACDDIVAEELSFCWIPVHEVS